MRHACRLAGGNSEFGVNLLFHTHNAPNPGSRAADGGSHYVVLSFTAAGMLLNSEFIDSEGRAFKLVFPGANPEANAAATLMRKKNAKRMSANRKARRKGRRTAAQAEESVC